MGELKISASLDKLDEVLEFLSEGLEAAGSDAKTISVVAIAAEEIFVNIARYAYTEKGGDAVISYSIDEDPRSITIIFTDSGQPYDPLKKQDPDITLSADERQIGGLGIYMVKEMMDAVAYAYEDGHNILTIRKNLA
jgi:anti-sigma regulatory factor (Ser/Thr protein kinase)